MFNIFKKDKLPKWIRRALAPNSDGLARRKALFLAAYEQTFGKTLPERKAVPVMKFAAGFLALFAVATSMSAYADTTNVPVTSPLYQLKRLSETARLTFTKQDDKPQLRAEFAGRRTNEIDDLKEKKPESNLLPSLAKDLHDEIDDSIKGAEENDLRDDKLSGFCGKIRAAITTSSAAIRDELSRHPKTLERLKEKCDDGEDDHKDNEEDGNKGDSSEKDGDSESGSDSNKNLRDFAPAAQILLRDAHKGGGRTRSSE